MGKQGFYTLNFESFKGVNIFLIYIYDWFKGIGENLRKTLDNN